jgi:hypothetical protein
MSCPSKDELEQHLMDIRKLAAHLGFTSESERLLRVQSSSQLDSLRITTLPGMTANHAQQLGEYSRCHAITPGRYEVARGDHAGVHEVIVLCRWAL